MNDLQTRILRFAKAGKSFPTADIVDFIEEEFSRQYVQRILTQLVRDKKLVKWGSTKGTRYALNEKLDELEMSFARVYASENLQEHLAWEDIENEMPFIRGLKENVLNIVSYAFSEMLNNAIDHSKSKEISVLVENKADRVYFSIIDWGIGVFNNIMKKKTDLQNPKEVIQELLKGKLTTDPKRHTGEGIFFTSKVCDSFYLNSEGFQLRDDKKTGEKGPFEITENRKGTVARCEIKRSRMDGLNDIFTQYYTDLEALDFDKTEVPIKLYTTIGRACISRSQARRVLSRLSNFKKVILDFEDVSILGQGFADEVFRVFHLNHPKIELVPINMNQSVEFMIERAKRD